MKWEKKRKCREKLGIKGDRSLNSCMYARNGEEKTEKKTPL
jgi:hypothetical protein